MRDVSPGGQQGGVGKGITDPAEGVVGSTCLKKTKYFVHDI